jgi:hypothetical protein
MKLVGLVQIDAGQSEFELAAGFSAGRKNCEQAGHRQLSKEGPTANQCREKEQENEAFHPGQCDHISSN